MFEHDGGRRTLRLNWRALPDPADDFWAQYRAATLCPGTQFGVTEAAPGVTWIGVPTFADEAAEQLQALVTEIETGAAAMRAGRATVIDVRGNGGGNSAWGVAVARAVFGADVIEAVPQPDAAAADWRVSAANRDYIAGLAPELIERFGADSEIGQWVVRVCDGISAALARGDALWRQREDGQTGPFPTGGGFTRQRPQGASPFPARVYVLSNGTCASACLDFADIVLHVPGVRLIGADTGADGLLMEVREQTLPSGLVSIVLPMKVIRGRARGSMEAYAADAAYDGVWTDEAVCAWVMKLIDAQ